MFYAINAMKILFYILTAVLVFVNFVYSQEVDSSKVIRDTTKTLGDTTVLNTNKQDERLFENYQDENEDSKLLDYLDYLENNPFELNSVTYEDLIQIPFLNSILVNSIINYREEIGGFKSKKDLLLVPGMNEDVYEDIKIYIYVKNSKYDFVKYDNGAISTDNNRRRVNIIKNVDMFYRTRLQEQLQPSAGYFNGNYPGSRYKIYNNFRASYINSKYFLEGNLIFEKDPGETDWNDFTSGYIELRDFKFIKEVIIGDYSLVFGQGLSMWSSLGFSKGSEAVSSTKKPGVGIKSYRSTNESQFFRGAATQLRFGNFDFIGFYSNNYYDASIDTTLNEVSSLYFEGYHRTATERNKENSVNEILFGSRITYTSGAIRLGSTYWTSKFSKPLIMDSVKQLFNFSGDKANMLGFDYDVVFQNINFYGEFARSQSGSIAGIGGLQLTFLKIADIVFLYRDYPIDFAPIHSFGFGEKNGNTQNERGLYSGISFNPVKGLSINAYYDQYKFPYRSYFEPVSLNGNDFLTYVQWKANKSIDVSFKYRNRNEEESITVLDGFGRDIKQVATKNQLNLRLDFTYEIFNNFFVRGRYDYVYVSYDQFGTNEKGNMFLSDIRFIPFNRFSVNFRLMFFNTDGWNSRLYEYEADVKGVMTNYAVSGQGRRWYLLLKWKPFEFAEFSAKYSETYKEGEKNMGSGNDLINGNLDNRINLMMEFLF